MSRCKNAEHVSNCKNIKHFSSLMNDARIVFDVNIIITAYSERNIYLNSVFCNFLCYITPCHDESSGRNDILFI